LGIRIAGYQLGNFTLDGTYIFGRLGSHTDDYWKGPKVVDILAQDLLFGARGKVGIFNLRAALLRHTIDDEHAWNWSILLDDTEVYPNIVVNGVYASYGATEDWLYEVNGTW